MPPHTPPPPPPPPKKTEVYSGPSKHELVLKLKRYNAAHEGSNKLPIPSLSPQSQLKVEILEARENQRIDAQNAQKEATKLIKELLEVERCINEGEDLELDWEGISKKCKSLMALLESEKSEKRGKSRKGEKEERTRYEGEFVKMVVEMELEKTLDAIMRDLEEEESGTDRNLGLIQVEKKSKLDAKQAQASNPAVHVHTHKQVSSFSDRISRLQAHHPIKDAAQRTKRWQEQVHKAAEIHGASKLQLYDKPNIEVYDKNRNKHTVKEDRGSRNTDQFNKERQDTTKRERFLKKLDEEKQYQKKQQERKERQRRERQQAESRMWKEAREKARLRREVRMKEQERSGKQEMSKLHHSRSHSSSKEYIEANQLYRPVNHIPARRSRSSDPRDTQNVSEPKPKTSTPKPRPASPEVRFTPSTKRDDHKDPSKTCTRFPKWLSSKPKRSPILEKYTEAEKEKELKRRREVAERLHSEVRKHD